MMVGGGRRGVNNIKDYINARNVDKARVVRER